MVVCTGTVSSVLFQSHRMLRTTVLLVITCLSWQYMEAVRHSTTYYSEEGSLRKHCPAVKNITQPPNRINTTSQLHQLRVEMDRMTTVQGPPVHAYVITVDDDHQSDNVAERDRRLRYISGFSGTNGVAVVTANKAALWTDGRYHVQADLELDCNWLLMGRGAVPSNMTKWITDVLIPYQRVGADPTLISNADWLKWDEELSKKNIYLVAVQNNLIDIIWKEGRPNYSTYQAYTWNISFAGTSWMQKVASVRTEMKSMDCDTMIVTALDEIAWLLNIRGRDIPYNPMLRAYVIITKEWVDLYVDNTKLSTQVEHQLQIHRHCLFCVRVRKYEAIWVDLKTNSQVWKRVLLPGECEFSKGVSRAIYHAIPENKRKVIVSPILLMKAKKGSQEKAGMRRAHVHDAAAFCDFISYLEEQLKEGEVFDEMKVSRILDQYRREQDGNRDISFPTIVAFGPHAAMPHYVPNTATNTAINKSNVLLIDSGGHYIDGTTDVTRTFHFGTPTERHIDIYTSLLQGSIDLTMLSFPEHLPMSSVDVLARAPLWQMGLDYRHGTGHGVGTFNSIHESPIYINWENMVHSTFREGYFFTNEPGFYKEGDFGMRLENVLEVIENRRNDTYGLFLTFRVVTLIPYESTLIDYSRLSPQQIHWLNDYNTRIRNEVGTLMTEQRRFRAHHWLMGRTKHIPEGCTSQGVLWKTNFILSLAMLIFLTTVRV